MNLEPVIDDAVLLDGLRRGDDHAFATLVRQHAGRMLATARRLLRDGDEAEDAVQEAFVSAARAIGGFAGDSKLSTWLHRIVVNTALMRLRSRRRRREEPIDDLLPRFDAAGYHAVAVVGCAVNTSWVAGPGVIAKAALVAPDRPPALVKSV